MKWSEQMKWLNKLEKKFGKYAINNLMLYIVILTGTVFLLSMMDRTGGFIYRLVLIPSRVMQGEIWRLFTYIFIPPTQSPLFIIFVLYFYYMIGNTLEQRWGAFKFNVYYFVGVIATTVVAFLTQGVATSIYLNLTLFLAFASLYPNYQILIFFILPVKMKYLAWLNWGLFAFTIFTAPLSQKITAIIALSNYFLFFARDIANDIKRKHKVHQNRRRFDNERIWAQESLHKCHVCGITEKDDAKMDFRYCSKCDGSYEYCEEHLHNHQHVQE